MSRKRNQWGTITAWTLLLSTALCGCGLGDVEELFTDPVALDEEARKDPKFWEAAVPVEGATNLYELDNDLFMGKPYNDVFRFGNDILFVEEAYYSDAFSDEEVDLSEVKYEYSFEVYSPWQNIILYSLHHKDITCDSFQVLDDELFLYDYNALTLSIYNDRLKCTGTYDISNIYQGEDLELFASSSDNQYFIKSDNSQNYQLVTIEDKKLKFDNLDASLYGTKPVSISDSGRTIALTGVDPLTLGYRTRILDVSSGATLYSVPSDPYYIGDLSDQTFVGSTNAYECFFTYADRFGNDAFFRKDDVRQIEVLDDASFVMVTQNLDNGESDYLLGFQRYDTAGQTLSAFSYECGNESSTGVYLSNHQAFFDEEQLGFILAYNTSMQPYLLVWDMTSTGEEVEPLNFFPTEAALSASVPSYYYTKYEETHDVSYGYTTTEIVNIDEYDWGYLTAVNEKASALERQYGIEIYLGPEVPRQIDHFHTSQQLDGATIDLALDALSNALACYPDNFFQQLAFGSNRGVRIYLTGSINGDGEGVLEDPSGFVNEINNYLVMVLNTSYRNHWDYTIAHELSHMIDRRLLFRNDYVSDEMFSEDTWDSYNPSGFEYLNSYEGYDHSEDYEKYSDFFIDSYSLTYATEDRAVLFGTAMYNYIKNIDNDDSFATGSHTATKYRYYCRCIRNGFDTTGWSYPTPWEYPLQN